MIIGFDKIIRSQIKEPVPLQMGYNSKRLIIGLGVLKIFSSRTNWLFKNLAQSILGERNFNVVQIKGQLPFKVEII